MAKVDDKVPSATLHMMGPDGPKSISTEEIFAPGKKVVAFLAGRLHAGLKRQARARVRGRCRGHQEEGRGHHRLHFRQ